MIVSNQSVTLWSLIHCACYGEDVCQYNEYEPYNCKYMYCMCARLEFKWIQESEVLAMNSFISTYMLLLTANPCVYDSDL